MVPKQFTPELPLPAQLSKYLFIDVEASSLYADSFPIEVGWTTYDLRSESMLLKPHATWTLEAWSQASERIHGTPYAVLHRQGVDIAIAAQRLNEVTRDKTVLSDNPEFDGSWLRQLYHDAGVEQAFTLNDASQLERMAALLSRLAPDDAQSLQEHVKAAYPYPHRAAPDSRRAAALFLVVALPHEVEAILAAA
jgi:hypothetical protein